MRIQQALLPLQLTAMISIAFTVILVIGESPLRADAAPGTVALRASDVQKSSETSSPEKGRDTRSALRLQKRIQQRLGFTLALEQALQGLRGQRRLLSRTVTVTFTTDDGVAIAPIIASVDRFPFWMTVEVSPLGMHSSLAVPALESALRETLPDGIRIPEHARLLRTALEGKVEKAQTDSVAKPGYDFDPAAAAQQISDALVEDHPEVEMQLKTVAGRIDNASGQDVGDLTLLATGKSNFEGSGLGRKSNIRKGLAQHLQNSVVPAGAEFSFNSVLAGVPISDWEMALGIFEGGNLRPVAGGGLCQVATTLYRAILNAGFPVLKRANHSLFVPYYEKYGVGIDATIFPGLQDLTFLNNTGHPLLIQAYTEGDEARVMIYGTPDGRVATLSGPYFSKNAPGTFTVNGRKLTSNEIGWEQQITFADGRIETHPVVSRYKSIPRSVVNKYLHAAAGESGGI